MLDSFSTFNKSNSIALLTTDHTTNQQISRSFGMPYDFNIAKSTISEGEKDRFLCLFLNADTNAINGIIDWEKATADFGSASVESMRVSLRNTFKKIEKAGGKIGPGGTATATPSTPSSGKKRKAQAEKVVDEDDNAGTSSATLKPKAKRARKKDSVVDALDGK